MHVLNISFLFKNKLYIIIISAIIIACILLYFSLFLVLKIPNTSLLKQSDIFSCKSYYAEYEITEISNKNRNIYTMNETYKKDSDNEYFKFGYKDFLNNDVSYIVCNDKIKIENSSQISSYILNSNNFKKSNLFSLATYIDIINNIENIECFKTNKTEKDNIEKYTITLDKNSYENLCAEKNECKYSDLFSNGLKLSKIDITISDNKPIDILVYTTDDNVYIDIKYIHFELNKEISSDIFKF